MRIIKFILRVILKTIVAVFVIAATGIIVLVTISGPYEEPEEILPEPLPALEELIPQGARMDNSLILRILQDEDITEMSLERYLIGVVAAEMPASFEVEALKAQAVAARTIVMYGMNVRPNARHPDAHACTDYTCCMAFTGDELLRQKWEDDYVRNITRIIGAVLDTDDIYMMYGRYPILAVFHSSSAGKTETSGNVWINDLSYLKSVDSQETAQQVPGYVSTVTVSALQFRETIKQAFPDAVFEEDTESWITEITRTESGRISELTAGEVVIRGTELRSMFALRSTAISLKWDGGDIVFTVTGYGHGVGLSQYGANAMALERVKYRDILAHYYTGIVFSDNAR